MAVFNPVVRPPADLPLVTLPSSDIGDRTLHLYVLYPGPMRVYGLPGKRTLTLMEGAGAWLPADPTRVLAEARWNMG